MYITGNKQTMFERKQFISYYLYFSYSILAENCKEHFTINICQFKLILSLNHQRETTGLNIKQKLSIFA